MKLYIILLIFLIITILYCCFKSYYFALEEFAIMKEYPSKANIVIVTSHYNEKLDWLEETKLPVVVCSKSMASPFCQASDNKGREASAFLKFIIDNYDQLPDHIAFIHGHENAWHQSFPKSILEIIESCADYSNHGYISLNNYFLDDREINSNANMQTLHEIWDMMFRPYLNRDPPDYLLSDCCAQFIVSKERVLNLPKMAYEKWYSYIMIDNPIDDGGYEISVVFEYMWHLIFGEPDVMTQDDNLKKFRCSKM